MTQRPPASQSTRQLADANVQQTLAKFINTCDFWIFVVFTFHPNSFTDCQIRTAEITKTTPHNRDCSCYKYLFKFGQPREHKLKNSHFKNVSTIPMPTKSNLLVPRASCLKDVHPKWSLAKVTVRVWTSKHLD